MGCAAEVASVRAKCQGAGRSVSGLLAVWLVGGPPALEARHLRWDHSDSFPWLDFEKNRIVVHAGFAKSAKDQWLPLHPVLRQALAELARTRPEVFPFRTRKESRQLAEGDHRRLVRGICH
jgi:hypothetical protein